VRLASAIAQQVHRDAKHERFGVDDGAGLDTAQQSLEDSCVKASASAALATRRSK
jgi:hypothetical protein